MPDGPTLDALHRLIASPFFGLFLAAVGCAAISVFCMRTIARLADQRHKTLEAGNRTLEQIQANIAVSTAHNASNVEAQRHVVAQLERLADRVHDHDRDEEARHTQTLAAIRERHQP